jgi:L-lactate dehydrogenase complex protein LldG
MSSRNNILKAIAAARYTAVSKPVYSGSALEEIDTLAAFLDASQRNGSEIVKVEDRDHAMAYFKIQSGSEALLLESLLGVAENGAIWLDEASLPGRDAPFACLHLFAVLSARDIVASMHDAYARLQMWHNGPDFPGFGVFIAGPSKTADIEQTLVMGAQGAKKQTILLIST